MKEDRNKCGDFPGEEKNQEIEALLAHRTLHYFYRLCKIPRGSGKEKAVSDYIYGWANELGLEVFQDALSNLVIKKPGRGGNADAAPLLLQAHLDMVCDKEPESLHDFEKDAIEWNVEGDWITSAKRTSLGADCGIGVALIMAVLEDRTHSHPPLEALFTVCEETDMSGAWNISPDHFHARRMINLDTSPDNRMLAGSCGGMAMEVEVSLEREQADVYSDILWIEIGGLTGGHSGADIHRGRGNAIVLMIGMLRRLQAGGEEFSISEMSGGNSRLAIPREAGVLLHCSGRSVTVIEEECGKYFEELQEVHGKSDSGLYLKIEKGRKKNYNALTIDCFRRLLRTAYLLPNGIQEMSSERTGNVESSSNLGVLRTTGEAICFVEEIRSVYPATRERIAEKGRAAAELSGADVKIHSEYPEWRYRLNSPLRKTVMNTWKQMNGSEMEVLTCHAGNEIGILSSRLGLEDAVAMGPSRFCHHTPKERLCISSSIKFEAFLKETLAEME